MLNVFWLFAPIAPALVPAAKRATGGNSEIMHSMWVILKTTYSLMCGEAAPCIPNLPALWADVSLESNSQHSSISASYNQQNMALQRPCQHYRGNSILLIRLGDLYSYSRRESYKIMPVKWSSHVITLMGIDTETNHRTHVSETTSWSQMKAQIGRECLTLAMNKIF